jgi:DNA replication protein DnaC
LTVTTNLLFADWVQIFQNERLTAALLDCLTDRATILEFLGESYRLRKTLKRKVRQEPPSGV